MIFIETIHMQVHILENAQAIGINAGAMASSLINSAIHANGTAHIILATGSSQFEILHHLVQDHSIDWSKVSLFHLDEYIGIPETNRASFRKYLKERFIDQVFSLKEIHLIQGDMEAAPECDRLSELIREHPIDLALVGIGENGHLAFNDPPADFETIIPYIIVELDDACRKQQLGEGWFDSLKDVPTRAISMSIKQIMKSKHIICSVPDKRKAIAVKNCLLGEISNQYPASILQLHEDCDLYLDKSSASLII